MISLRLFDCPISPLTSRALVEGRQPVALTPTRLLRLSKDLPHDCNEQQQFLGFAGGKSIIAGRNAL
jgi:hypothetical protein